MCQHDRCAIRWNRLKFLEEKEERWEGYEKAALLRREMRSTVGDANEAVRRMEAVVASTQKEMYNKAWHMFHPKLEEVERKAAALRLQLAAEKLEGWI